MQTGKQHRDPSTPARSAGDECRRPTAEFNRRLRHGTWQPNIWDQTDIAGSARNVVRDIARRGG